MMKQTAKNMGWIVVGLQLALGVSAFAQSNVSTATQSTTWDKVKEKLRLQYVGEFSGPSLTHLYSPDATGDVDDTINLNNKIAAGYRFSKAWLADATFDVKYSPLGKNPSAVAPLDSPFAIKDMFLRGQNVSQFGPLLLVSDLRGYIPLSNGSQASALTTGIRNSLYTDVTIPSSKWTVGHFSYLRGNLYHGLGNGKGDAFTAHFALHANYAFTDALALYLWSDLVRPHVDRKGNTSWEYANFQAGVSWDLTKAINFNPYVQIFPGSLSLASTSVNFVLTANVF